MELHIVSVSSIYWAIQKQHCTSHCMCQSFTGKYRSSIVCVNHLLGNTEVALYVSIISWEIQKQHCTSHCICVNHLLVNIGVVLYVTMYVPIIYQLTHEQCCTSRYICVNYLLGNTEIALHVTLCVNHLLTNTGIVWYATLYLCQSFTEQYRSSIVRHIVSVLIIYWAIQEQYYTSHCMCQSFTS